MAKLRLYTGEPIGVYGDGERELQSLTVSTFESARRHMDRFGNRFGLLVADEAHHFGSERHAEALEMCPAPARLGLTATPPGHSAGLERLTTLLGPIVFEQRVGALTGTHLARLERCVIRVELTPAERAAYERGYTPFIAAFRAFSRGRAYHSWSGFVDAAARSTAGRELIRGFCAARRIVAAAQAKAIVAEGILRNHPDDRLLFFCAENGAAYALSRQLLIPAVTCDITRRERASILERFRDGQLRALVSSRVLNEGIDVPDARVAVVLGGRFGTREHLQRIGRVLRPAPDKTAVVYDVIARGTFESSQHHRRKVELCSQLS